MTPRDPEEYAALRATIRERGTARICVFAFGVSVWAALTIATAAALSTSPVAILLPLVALTATFEAVLALHVGVERIGRYLQVFHDDRWEQVAMAFGRPPGAVHLDALFSAPFSVAALVNLVPMLVANPVPVEWIFVGGAHALFLLRVLTARAAAARQRAVDLERFTQLKNTRVTAEDAKVQS
jgi:hypothetical protein